MQGFRNFIESYIQGIDPISGISELARLEERHRFFFLKTTHQDSESLMRGGHILSNFQPGTLEEIHKQMAGLDPIMDTILILSLPKRWEKESRVDIPTILGEMANKSQINNYIWGSYSLWNPRIEEQDKGGFYRNSRYHAHDGLLERWLQEHPVPKVEKPAIPLDRSPRVMGHHLLNQGRHSFHGYNQSLDALR